MLPHRPIRPRMLIAGIAACALVVAAVAQAAAPPRRAAARRAEVGVPPAMIIGFDADTLSLGGGDRDGWFTRMSGLGSTWVRVTATWAAIAPRAIPPGFGPADPSDPHYAFGYLDDAVRRAAAAHQQVLVTVESAPAWALGPGAPRSAAPGTWRPSPQRLAEFARALATRYSGHFPDPSQPSRMLPAVSYFQAWNEPNLLLHLAPQWTRDGRTLTPASPTIYRGLLDAFYRAVKTVQPRAVVLAAGLAPYGDPPGGQRMHPIAFLRGLMCLSDGSLRPGRCASVPLADAFDVHPYSLRPNIHAFSTDDVSVPDIGRIARVVAAAVRVGHLAPRGTKPIWVSELGWESSPPGPAGPSPTVQGRYLSLAFSELWREGVNHVMWYVVHDWRYNGDPLSAAGLFTSTGRAKPAAAAFRFPFVAAPAGGGRITVWGRAPAAGRVTIERATGNGWRALFSLGTTDGGVFLTTRRVDGRPLLRARAGSGVSLSYPAG